MLRAAPSISRWATLSLAVIVALFSLLGLPLTLQLSERELFPFEKMPEPTAILPLLLGALLGAGVSVVNLTLTLKRIRLKRRSVPDPKRSWAATVARTAWKEARDDR